MQKRSAASWRSHGYHTHRTRHFNSSNGPKLCEWCSVPRQDFLSAVFKCESGVSLSVQHAVSHAKTNNTCCQWFPPPEAALVLQTILNHSSNRCNTENYRHGFLPITDSSANQLSVPINRSTSNIYIYIYIYGWNFLKSLIPYLIVKIQSFTRSC